MGTRKVLSFDNWQEKARRANEPTRALRFVSFFLLIFPVVGLFTGYYREMGLVVIYQAVMYLFGFFGLRALARKRETNSVEKYPTEQ